MSRTIPFGLHVVALLALGACGCASPHHAYFSPARTRATVSLRPGDERPVETAEFLPRDPAPGPVRLACEARMVEEDVAPNLVVSTLRIRIWLYNFSTDELELRPSEFAVRDELGRTLPPSEVRRDGKRVGIILVKPPARASADLIIRLPDGTRPAGAQSFTLLWGFRLAGREYRHETVFERGENRAFRDPFAPMDTRS